MKIFIERLFLISCLFVVVFIVICSLANGTTDPFYMRFTTPKQNNLIIGTSRAAQGLQPSIFDSILKKNMYNFAFTIAHSPYGPTYLEKIKTKLNQNEKSGVFIVTVDPWSISSRSVNPNDYKKFDELKLCLGNTVTVNMNPNVEYLFKNFDGQYLTLLSKINTGMFLHDDGWLELSVKMDSISTKERLIEKVEDYTNNHLQTYQFSSYRTDYLLKTVSFLKKHGQVFLVRLPIHEKMMDIENQLMPDFEQKIEGVIHIADGYYDFTTANNSYTYVDGNHLYKVSGRQVSMEIANLIKQFEIRK